MRLTIAIQKKGRLYDETIKMFKNAGFRFTKDSTGFIMPCENAEFDLILLRDDDIPTVVAQNGCHLGIVGKNTIHENILQQKHEDGTSFIEGNTTILKELPFAKCRLSLAGNKKLTAANLENTSIATSYPFTLKHYLEAKKAKYGKFIELKGSVEIAPKLKIAQAICDLVSSGMTLKENNLIEGETVLKSNAVLIGNANFSTENKAYLNIIESITQPTTKNMKYIMFNCKKNNLKNILEIISFCKSPTILPIDDTTNAIHFMCKEDQLWNIQKPLKTEGATSILVLSVEKAI